MPEPIGLKWKDVGPEKPTNGIAFTNKPLAAALATRCKVGFHDARQCPPLLPSLGVSCHRQTHQGLCKRLSLTQFDSHEAEQFGLPGLKLDDHIYCEALGHYFAPAPIEQITWDPRAGNNLFDPPSARYVYEQLINDPRFWFIVVTRHAVTECQLPRSAFDGSTHPVSAVGWSSDCIRWCGRAL